MTEQQFDVIIIGGGPGGYVCAIKAAQLGLKVACIEGRGKLGGTCLNVGCIPSKFMLYASEQYEHAQHDFDRYGISCGNVKLDLTKVNQNNHDNIASLNGGIELLFNKNKITYIKGYATIKAAGLVAVEGKEYQAKSIVIATGSEVMPLPGVEPDDQDILTSDSVFGLKKAPKSLAVIGGGYIGLEMGSVWNRYGSEVTVIEFLDRIVPGLDAEIGKEFHKILQKQGMKFQLGTKVLAADKTKKGVKLSLEDVASGEKKELVVEKVLLSIGRRPYTAGLGLENVGIELNQRGQIEVDAHFATKVSGIYAIGDVTPGPMLAHKAEEEGVAVAEMLAGQSGHVDYNVIPAVVYTAPEVATVGKTEEELKEAGISYKKGKFSMMANSRAKTMGKTEGFVKVLACSTTDKLLGVHILAVDAGTMIAEAASIMAFGGSSEDMARVCHAHPTLNEAVKEAALATFAKPIHS